MDTDSSVREQLFKFQLKGAVEKQVELGRGSYAAVLEVNYRGLKCAGKKLFEVLHEQNIGIHLKRFLEECSLLASLRHPNIVQFIGIYFQAQC